MKYTLFVIVCLIIHAVVNIDIFRKKPTVNLPAINAYRIFVVSTALYFLGDLIWAFFLEYKMPIPLYISTIAYFVFMAFTIVAWTNYVVRYLQIKNWFGKAFFYIGIAFFAAEVILLIVNIFTPVLFKVDMETSQYITYKGRNMMLYIQILLNIILFLFTTYYIIRRKGAFRRRYITICLYSVIMGTAISIQVYNAFIPVYSVGCIVGMAFLNAFVIADIKEEYKTALAESRAELREGQQELDEARVIAYTDPLTGIKNKHAYVEEEERIDKLIAKGEMEEFAVVVFDLNGLKIVNDTKGHDAGDAYIIDACKTIEYYFSGNDLYRFGGDEFVVILTGEGFKKRSKLLSDFERYIDSCIGTEKPIISSGMSRYRHETDNTYHAVFIRADKIMYARKDALKEQH